MSSPSDSMEWFPDTLLESSLMTSGSGICTSSVFDKFGFDSEFTDDCHLKNLDGSYVKSEPNDDPLYSKPETYDPLYDTISPLIDLFPELRGVPAERGALISQYDDLTDSLISTSKLSSTPLSNTSFADGLILKQDLESSSIEEVENSSSNNTVCTKEPSFADNSIASTALSAVTTMTGEKTNSIVRMGMTSMSTTVTANATTLTTTKPAYSSIIRLPVKRSINANIGSTAGGRIKAVVVCPDRAKSIVCNVVRSTNKGIVIQKPVNRSWLNVGSVRNETSKVPIKVNVISSRENVISVKSLVNKTLPLRIKQEPGSNLLYSASNANISKPLLLPATNIKLEADEEQSEAFQSSCALEEEFHPFSSPSKDNCSNFQYGDDNFQDDLYRHSFLDDDNLGSDSYKCYPLAEVTGQVQPIIPEIFKYTPNNSPTFNGGWTSPYVLHSAFKTSYNNSLYSSQFHNKAAANVDHDHGSTYRTLHEPNNFLSSLCNVQNLGVQTPSGSEPQTESEDNDDYGETNLLNDLLNEKLERQCTEHFSDLSQQYAEVNCEAKGKLRQSSNLSTAKGRKLPVRNTKRKLTRGRSAPLLDTDCVETTTSNCENLCTNNRTVKMRLPVRNNVAKKRKSNSGGRVFSPSERHLHNTNEQERRVEMKGLFDELRKLIPNLLDKPRAAKVTILQEAKMYCDELYRESLEKQTQIAQLKCQKAKVIASLAHVQRDCSDSWN